MTPDDLSASADTLDDVFAREPAPEGREYHRDEVGKFAPKPEEKPVEQPVVTDVTPVTPPQAAPLTPQADEDKRHHVPVAELLKERQSRQEKERELLEAKAQAQAYERMVQQFQQQRQEPRREAQPPPDPNLDPEGALHYHTNALRQEFRNEQLNEYEDAVREQHGEAVDKALAAAQAAGALPLITAKRNPWKELMTWHKRHAVVDEVGGDLEAYKKRIADETRAAVLAELKAGGASSAGTRFPGSLAAATGQGAQGAHLTDEAALGDVFASGRNRKHG